MTATARLSIWQAGNNQNKEEQMEIRLSTPNFQALSKLLKKRLPKVRADQQKPVLGFFGDHAYFMHPYLACRVDMPTGTMDNVPDEGVTYELSTLPVAPMRHRLTRITEAAYTTIHSDHNGATTEAPLADARGIDMQHIASRIDGAATSSTAATTGASINPALLSHGLIVFSGRTKLSSVRVDSVDMTRLQAPGIIVLIPGLRQ